MGQGERVKGEGGGHARAKRLRGPCTQKEGGAPILAAPPILPRSRASPGPLQNGGAAFSTPRSHGQGGAKGAAGDPVLSCSTVRGQGVRAGGGAYLLRAALRSPFAHGGVARTQCVREETGHPPPNGVHTGGGHAAKGGGGCKLCVFASLTPFGHPLLPRCTQEGERADSGSRRRGGRKGVVKSFPRVGYIFCLTGHVT